ncbi:MAG: alpha/beta hydrolase [Alphaproteobacteria bacterium]|nr:alpha/beta hydrolase [Alphaproteobacteria bacterium]
MSDGKDSNISKSFFEHYHQINDGGSRPLTNIYWSRVPRSNPVYGTVYLIHGYGGSPVEPCMKVPMQKALEGGFDVVALEGVDLSATAGEQKQISAMTLARQKQALEAGLKFCQTIDNINHSYNIGWIHSISCRALSDLMIDSMEVRHYFNELVLNNPYFLPPPKVQILREKFMRRDPSGATWDTLVHKVTTQMREIEHHTFKIPTCLYNLYVPLPMQWTKRLTFEKLARRVSYLITHRPKSEKLRLRFILGSADDMADFNQNMRFFKALTFPHKQVVAIDGANHAFENALTAYSDCTQDILASIREYLINQK